MVNKEITFVKKTLNKFSGYSKEKRLEYLKSIINIDDYVIMLEKYSRSLEDNIFYILRRNKILEDKLKSSFLYIERLDSYELYKKIKKGDSSE